MKYYVVKLKQQTMKTHDFYWDNSMCQNNF